METVNKYVGRTVSSSVNRSRLIHSLSILAVGLSFVATGPAAKAENPLEKLRNHILGELFGDRHNGDKDHGKKKKKNKDDDRRDRENHDGWSYDVDVPALIEAFSDGDRFDVQTAVTTHRSADSHPLEEDVQTALQREGYYRGPINGDLDTFTRSAIRDYQSDHSLAATGHISRDLLRSLGL